MGLLDSVVGAALSGQAQDAGGIDAGDLMGTCSAGS